MPRKGWSQPLYRPALYRKEPGQFQGVSGSRPGPIHAGARTALSARRTFTRKPKFAARERKERRANPEWKGVVWFFRAENHPSAPPFALFAFFCGNSISEFGLSRCPSVLGRESFRPCDQLCEEACMLGFGKIRPLQCFFPNDPEAFLDRKSQQHALPQRAPELASEFLPAFFGRHDRSKHGKTL